MCDFKCESYIRWPRLSNLPLDSDLDKLVDRYLLPSPSWVHLVVQQILPTIPLPHALLFKSQYHWSFIKWNLIFVYFIHVFPHPYSLAEFTNHCFNSCLWKSWRELILSNSKWLPMCTELESKKWPQEPSPVSYLMYTPFYCTSKVT